MAKLKARVREVVEGTAEVHGLARADVAFPVEVPATHNDPATFAFAENVAAALFGAGVDRMPRRTGAEDFSFYMENIPSTFLYLGTGNATLGTDVGAHNPYFKVDESVLPRGAAFHAALALASAGGGAAGRGQLQRK